MHRIVSVRLGLFIFGFLFFVLFRLLYGLAVYPNGQPINEARYYSSGPIDFELSRRNYAGQKQKSAGGLGSAMPQALDQRYEKIADIGLVSEAFDEDEAAIRGVAKDVGALIQFEQAFGLEGARRLQLALGVPPEEFDNVIGSIRDIGKQVSFQVNKTDKTNEYRSLLARQSSLEKSRDGLIALKAQDAELDDLIALERSILELENQIQDLGVAVGEFDSEFEFVTVKLVLSEVAPPKLREIGLASRLKTAVEWAVPWYLALNLALLAFLASAYLWVRLRDWRKPA